MLGGWRALVLDAVLITVAALLGAVVSLVAGVRLDCVAGGVERPEQAEQLRRLGCRRAVGPLFGTATPAFEVIFRPEISYA
jgi:EAL domain-containing protein (putative c-di-GMP-specific phosphodiesterase class I)